MLAVWRVVRGSACVCDPATGNRMPRTILVIDDEEDMRELSTFALELDGQTSVVTASSGADGLRLAREVQPTAILLDWMMPGMDGETTLAALKGNPLVAGIPVIVLSGAAHHHSVESFKRLGAHGVVAKPYNPVTLGDEVRALLGTA